MPLSQRMHYGIPTWLLALSGAFVLTSASAQHQTIGLVSLTFSKKDTLVYITLDQFTTIETDKPLLRENTRLAPGDYVCLVTDETGVASDTLYVRDPLHVRYEYPGEGDTIGSAEFRLDRQSVVLRFRYRETSRTLRIERLSTDRQPEILAIFPLPRPKE